MPDDFLVARNPEESTTLPYLVRLPLGERGVVLKAREPWPRTSKVYCHPAEWPAAAEIVERVPTKSCVRRGASIDLILDRRRENRSQFVFARARGRQVIFWQTSRVSKLARPDVSLPSARAAGIADIEVVVDAHERYAWTFAGQQVTTTEGALSAGDYAVRVGETMVAVVERKSLNDLVTSLLNGRLRSTLTDLALAPHAAVVVEDRYSSVFKLTHVRPAVVADAIAESGAQFPSVPVIFAETRKLAQEWTYRFFGAALAEFEQERGSAAALRALPSGRPVPDRTVTTADVRSWARKAGLTVPDRGRLRPEIWEAYRREHPS